MYLKIDFIKKVQKKCKGRNGETITEVLVASLVIAFGSILLATMVTASTKIIQKSMIAYDHYMDIHNGAESLTATGLPSGLQMKTIDGTIVTLEASKEESQNIILAGDACLSGRKLNTNPTGGTKTFVSDGTYNVSVNETVDVYTVPQTTVSSKYSFTKYFSTRSEES